MDARRDGDYVVTRLAPIAHRAPFEAQPALEHLDWASFVVAREVRLTRAEGDEVELAVLTWSSRHVGVVRFGGVALFQGPLELEVGAVHALDPDDVARRVPELVRYWPPLEAGLVVFRLDPPRFGASLFVVARRADFVPR